MGEERRESQMRGGAGRRAEGGTEVQGEGC